MEKEIEICCLLSLDGVDNEEESNKKIWKCNSCGRKWRFITQEDGVTEERVEVT
jgi:ribosomal protein L37AE/L43A